MTVALLLNSLACGEKNEIVNTIFFGQIFQINIKFGLVFEINILRYKSKNVLLFLSFFPRLSNFSLKL